MEGKVGTDATFLLNASRAESLVHQGSIADPTRPYPQPQADGRHPQCSGDGRHDRQLLDADQDAIAAIILEELEDDRRWNESLSRSAGKLDALVAKAK